MSFDDLALSVASTLSGVFGGTYSYVNDGNPAVDVPLVLRKDVELLDVDGQIAARVNTVRIAHQDVSFVPQRGDTFVIGAKTYTVGRR
ncbi:MAG: hypothetical protein KDI07_26035, partial [Anaerolineae bacterium]|nr:hypothetical protein [Anaerolineae bacterium]